MRFSGQDTDSSMTRFGFKFGGLRAGFTLIEMLAVILIIGILSAVLLTQLGGTSTAAKVQQTRQQLTLLGAAIENYEMDGHGEYPPSRFSDKSGVSNDGSNVGMEALVVALWSEGYEAGGLLDTEADRLQNTDGDSSSRGLTDFDSRGLFEIVDAWENPIAYFNRRDYDSGGGNYLTFDPVTGGELESVAKPLKNSTTGRFYNAGTFQMISAGPDGLFGTEDDVTSFNRRLEDE
ncbi:MAG: prepilin-type N-terminal cleavage/methylation domain-containing protein [Planctomycetota bacterium]|jgi:prepilin-type N-terminal cleavage/methylation domain-containing protein